MKKLLLFFALCTSLGAWAQTAEFVESDEGATLTINASGDLTLADFTTNLAAKVKSGDFTKVQFVNTNASEALVIDYKVISAILYADGYNKEIGVLDLGQTTLPGLNYLDFCNNVSDNAGYYAANLNLTELTIPLVPAVGDEVVVPGDVLKMWNTPAYGATGCTPMTTVRVPEGYTKIGDNAFRNCQVISDFILPTTVTSIGNSSFENSGSVAWIDLPSNLTYIGKRAFMGTILTGMEFPASLDKIDDAAFANLVTYDKVVLNEGLRFIGNSAFCLPSAITKEVLNIPASVRYIGPAAFGFRYYRDVVYHSLVAPVSPLGNSCVTAAATNVSAFYKDMYEGFNGNQSAPSAKYPLADNNLITSTELDVDGNPIKYGYANRENYQNTVGGVDRYFGMLHFPSGLTVDQYDTYKDHTRIYVTNSGTSKHDFNNTTFGGVDIPVPVGSEPEKEKTFNGSTTSPGYEGRYNNVPSGYVDTYRGDQYVWPSQGQWERAFIEASCGYNWDGVTKYRPTLTPEEIALMVEDGEVCIDGVVVDLTASTELDEAKANAYNATLPGAWAAPKVKTPADYYTKEEADGHNMTLDGHIAAGETLYYTQTEINEHNAELDGAISTSVIKEPAVEHKDAVYYTSDEIVWVNNVSYDKSTVIYHPAQAATYYSDDEITKSPYNNNQWYKNEDIESLDGYYSEEYLTGKGIANWNFIYGDDKKLEDGVTLYKFTGIVAKAGATALGYDNQKPFMKTPAVNEFYETTADSKQASTQTIKIPEVEGHGDIYYTEDEVNEANASLPNAWNSETVKGVATAETAAIYNASLPGAWTTSTVKTPAVYYTESEINEHNAGLDDAKSAGATMANTELYADGLSMIAYMGTRQFVFADGDGQPGKSHGDEPTPPSYEIPVEGHHWWTLCVPFNMTKKEIDETFGTGTHVCLFSGVDRDVTSDTKKITLKFQNDVYAHKTVKDLTTGVYSANFSKTAAPAAEDDIVIYAHEAYMIWPTITNDDAVFVVANYQTVPGSPVPTIVRANAANANADADHTEYRFIGNYIDKIAVEVDEDATSSRVAQLTTVKVPAYSYVYAISKGAECVKDQEEGTCSAHKFWFVKNNKNTWKPNKCIVQATAKDGGSIDYSNFFGGPTSSVKQISLFGEDSGFEEEFTGIEEVTVIAGEDTDKTYNLNGQMVNPNNLSKGIYIKNGKKVLVR